MPGCHLIAKAGFTLYRGTQILSNCRIHIIIAHLEYSLGRDQMINTMVVLRTKRWYFYISLIKLQEEQQAILGNHH